jgi:hypothetical protein
MDAASRFENKMDYRKTDKRVNTYIKESDFPNSFNTSL